MSLFRDIVPKIGTSKGPAFKFTTALTAGYPTSGLAAITEAGDDGALMEPTMMVGMGKGCICFVQFVCFLDVPIQFQN